MKSRSVTSETWFRSQWRPAMAWLYAAICLMDFIVFPICWNIMQHASHVALTQWSPMTLQGAGMVHLAFGAVIGISAYGRTKEKLAIPESTTD